MIDKAAKGMIIDCAILITLAYGVFSFVAMEPNPYYWHIVWRAVFSMITIGIPFYIILNRS